jgi:hypothetical protein
MESKTGPRRHIDHAARDDGQYDGSLRYHRRARRGDPLGSAYDLKPETPRAVWSAFHKDRRLLLNPFVFSFFFILRLLKPQRFDRIE